MSKSNLGKRLIKDLKRSPAKSAVLGISLMVAVYFWGPLLWEWFGPAETPEIADATDVATAVVAAVTSTTSATPSESEVDYAGLLKQLENQNLLASTSLSTVGQTAFTRLAPVIEPADELEIEENTDKAEDEGKAEPDETAVTARDLGLVLTSVVTGPGFQVAKLNGITVTQGELIEVETIMGPLMLQVKQIQPDYVTLSSESTEYRIDRDARSDGAKDETAAIHDETTQPTAKKIPLYRGES